MPSHIGHAVRTRRARDEGKDHMTRLTVMAVALLVMLGVVAPASATDSRIAVDWIQATCQVDPGEQSINDGAMHVRGEMHYDTIWMDVEPFGYVPVGTNLITFDYDVSLKTLNGRGGGTFFASLPGSSFSGHFNGGIKGGMLTAQAVGDGSGLFDGAKMTALIVQFQPDDDQLEWLCDGGEVTKAVTVSALIRP